MKILNISQYGDLLFDHSRAKRGRLVQLTCQVWYSIGQACRIKGVQPDSLLGVMI